MLQGTVKRKSNNRDYIRSEVEQGRIPKGITTAEAVISALQKTVAPNAFEIWGLLTAKVKRASGINEDLGLVSVQKVTTAFAAYLVDSMQDSSGTPMDVFKYHGSGTGNTAEANTQTALVTEVEDRATGDLGEGATGNIFKTVGTQTYTATRTIAEHGVFSADAAGTMLDRSLLGSTIPVESADEIEWTYQLTVTAEA